MFVSFSFLRETDLFVLYKQSEEAKLPVHHKQKKCNLTLFRMVEGDVAKRLAAIL